MLQTMEMEEDQRGTSAGHGAFIYFFVLGSRLHIIFVALIPMKANKM